MLKHCEQCGKKFNIIPARANTARFCSRSCRRGENSPTWKGGKVKLSCEFCGKEFEVSPYRAETARLCSTKCSALWRSGNLRGETHPLWKEKVKLHCEICDKEFQVSPHRADKARFCSMRCMGLWKSEALRGENGPAWKGGEVKLPCEMCGEEFGVKPHLAETARFCSMRCMGLWRSENLRGENSPGWRGGNVKLVCETCGREFDVKPYLANQRFCSPSCYNQCGENNPNWQGGISFEPYGLEFDDKLKKEIRKRDDYTCAISGEPGHHVHHINYCKTDNRPENLITLCIRCHGKTGANREYYRVLLAPIAIARTTGMWIKDKVELVAMVETHTTPERVYGSA